MARTTLVLASVLFSLLVAEIAARIWRDPATLLNWTNLVLRDRRFTVAQGERRLMHDTQLGFIARPGYAGGGYSYDSKGYRIAPAPAGAPLAEPPIAILGDSFTHGDEIGDAQAWPARVQGLLGRRTINAAVTGYALDQIVLRAEIVAKQEKPAAIVAAFVADDLRRSEMKRVWGVEKPYFQSVDGKLVVRNVPVPPRPNPADTLDVWQWLFGWSMALDVFLHGKGWQYEWAVDHERVLPRGTAQGFACAMMRRLAATGVPTLVVAGYDPYNWKNAEYSAEQRRQSALVLRCADEAGMTTLDLFETMDAVVKARGHEAVFMVSHPSPIGAAAIGERVAAELQRLPLRAGN